MRSVTLSGCTSHIRLPSISVDPPGVEPGSPECRSGVFPLDHEPVVVSVDRMRVELIAPILQGSVASTEHASPEVRSGIEPDLPPYRGGVLPEHLQTFCSRSDPGRTRTVVFLAVAQASLPLDHGIK